MTKISGYTTTRNCVDIDYPFEEAIRSMLDFCDEVVVADSSDKEDGTAEKLTELMNEFDKLKVFHVDVDWSKPNHGICDGQMKAVARSRCTGEYLWQQDADEIVEPGIRTKIESLLQQASSYMDQAPLIALPVLEYWGGKGKVRIDVNPWKWRLSRNLPYITHGIPAHLRKEENGLLYAKHGTDGCCYINTETGALIPFSNFVTPQVEMLRQKAITDEGAAREYGIWLNMVAEHLPTVYHFSWYSIAAKILKFRYFWNGSWLSLYNEQKPEGWNPFFADKTLDEVSDKEIKELATKLERECGGHIFHKPWNGKKTNHITLDNPVPTIMTEWCRAHQDG